jgi:hypothetical protein
MPKLMRPITQSDYLISIANVKGVFSKFSGGEEEFDTSDYVDPADRRKKTVRGVVMVGDVTLAKPFHPTDDAALIDLWQKYRDDGTPEEGFTVTVQAIKNDRNRTPIGKPRTYYGCQIIKFTRPEADLEGSDVAMLEIEMSVDHVEEA